MRTPKPCNVRTGRWPKVSYDSHVTTAQVLYEIRTMLCYLMTIWGQYGVLKKGLLVDIQHIEEMLDEIRSKGDEMYCQHYTCYHGQISPYYVGFTKEYTGPAEITLLQYCCDQKAGFKKPGREKWPRVKPHDLKERNDQFRKLSRRHEPRTNQK